jgi:hypothetical protein
MPENLDENSTVGKVLDELILLQGLPAQKIIERSLAVLLFFLKRKREGYTVLIQRKDCIREVHFPDKD